jgi:hypothetical protein
MRRDDSIRGLLLALAWVCVGVWPGAASAEETPGQQPLFPQEALDGCQTACARMVIATQTGKDIPEQVLRQGARDATPWWTTKTGYDGTNPYAVAPLLRTYGVRAQTQINPWLSALPGLGRALQLKPASRLQRWVSGGPVIAGMSGHAIVVDRVVTGSDGTRLLHVRDPWPPGQGSRRTMTEREFDRDFSYVAVRIKPDRPASRWRHLVQQACIFANGTGLATRKR